MLRCLLIVGVVGLFFANGARADAITEIFDTNVELFKSYKGDGEPTEISRDDIVLPAAVLSNKSPLGLIRVRFEFKTGDKKPVIGWVDASAINIDKTKPDIKVPGCATPGQHAGVSRGSRGFAGACK